MSKDKLIVVGVVVSVIMMVSLLVLNIYTVRRVVYLDRFFTTVSEEYRGIRGGSAPQIATGNGNDGGGGGNGGRTCITTDLDIDNEPAIGDRNAPVTMVEYSDFECPFCARYFSDAYGQIKERYIDTGMVQLYFKDFPLDNIHPLARPAAIVANCVYERQGDSAFFDIHDRMFALQGQLGSVAALDQFAMDIGVSASELDACRNDSAYHDEITADFNEGQSIGISGTPSFVINGQLIVGALPFAEFERAIEDALAGNGCQG